MNETLINALQRQFGPTNVLFGPTILAKYESIWGIEEALEAQAIVYPTSTTAISKLLKYCHQHQQAVAIWEGKLKIVGAIKLDGSKIIISMEEMTTIDVINDIHQTISVQAGAQLATIQQVAKEEGLFFPLLEEFKKDTPINELLYINTKNKLEWKHKVVQNLLEDIELVLGNGTIVSSFREQKRACLDEEQLFKEAGIKHGIITKVSLKLLPLNC